MFVKGVTTVSKAWRLILSGKNAEVGIKCIESLDEFLMGSASLVFGMGLYELFIAKMELADPVKNAAKHAAQRRSGFNLAHRPAWLALEDLSDLKHRTGSVVVFVFIVRTLEAATKMGISEPVHLLYLGGAALLSAMSITLMGVEFNDHKDGMRKEHARKVAQHMSAPAASAATAAPAKGRRFKNADEEAILAKR